MIRKLQWLSILMSLLAWENHGSAIKNNLILQYCFQLRIAKNVKKWFKSYWMQTS